MEGSDRNVGQPDHILGHHLAGRETEWGAGAGEEGLAVTDDDGVEVDPGFVDQAQIGQASRQSGSCHLDLPLDPGLVRGTGDRRVMPDLSPGSLLRQRPGAENCVFQRPGSPLRGVRDDKAFRLSTVSCS